MKKEVYYKDYLKLDQLLSVQSRESEKNGHPAHDEMLFIITHQTLELWMKQFLFELEYVVSIFDAPTLSESKVSSVFHCLRRMTKIQDLMSEHLGVLETMYPLDFLEFRDDLIPASGFQSVQFKQIEQKLGLWARQTEATKSYAKQSLRKEDQSVLKEPSATLFKGVCAWLERNPFLNTDQYRFGEAFQSALTAMFEKELDLTQNHPHLTSEQQEKERQNIDVLKQTYTSLFEENDEAPMSKKAVLSALFIHFYREYPMIQMPYLVLRTLIDLDMKHRAWKQSHLNMVQKMIGLKMGTGGSSGQAYLARSLKQSQLFPELVELPSLMVSRKHIPTLPPEMAENLNFRWT